MRGTHAVAGSIIADMRALLFALAGAMLLVVGYLTTFPDARRLAMSERDLDYLRLKRSHAELGAQLGRGPWPTDAEFHLLSVSESEARLALGQGIAAAAGALVCFGMALRSRTGATGNAKSN
jgi:hypothetical protein